MCRLHGSSIVLLFCLIGGCFQSEFEPPLRDGQTKAKNKGPRPGPGYRAGGPTSGKQGRKTAMDSMSRRMALAGSIGVAATCALSRPYIANAAATTATVWQVQGFFPEEDAAFRKVVADYQK